MNIHPSRQAYVEEEDGAVSLCTSHSWEDSVFRLREELTRAAKAA